MTHWAVKYLGRPWREDAEGPDAFYCWSFVRWAQRAEFGRELPFVPFTAGTLEQERLFRRHPEHARWTRVAHPREGDLVLVRQSRMPRHVGIFTAADGGKLVHCDRPRGVEAPRLAALLSGGWAVEGFYSFKGDE